MLFIINAYYTCKTSFIVSVVYSTGITSIVRATELEWCFFANNSVIIASATMKLDQDLVRLTP